MRLIYCIFAFLPVCLFNPSSAQICNQQLPVPAATLAKAHVKKVSVYEIDPAMNAKKLRSVFLVAPDGYVTEARNHRDLGGTGGYGKAECSCSADSLQHMAANTFISKDGKATLYSNQLMEYNKTRQLIRRSETTYSGEHNIVTSTHRFDPANVTSLDQEYTQIINGDTIRYTRHIRAVEKGLSIERDWKDGQRTEKKTISYHKKGEWTHSDEYLNGKLVRTVKNGNRVNKDKQHIEYEENNNPHPVPDPYRKVIDNISLRSDIDKEIAAYLHPRLKDSKMRKVEHSDQLPYDLSKDRNHHELFYSSGLPFADVWKRHIVLYEYELF